MSTIQVYAEQKRRTIGGRHSHASEKPPLGGFSVSYILISISTPAGRVKLINDSITFWAGLKMSITLL